jgi:hypothetical protein
MTLADTFEAGSSPALVAVGLPVPQALKSIATHDSSKAHDHFVVPIVSDPSNGAERPTGFRGKYPLIRLGRFFYIVPFASSAEISRRFLIGASWRELPTSRSYISDLALFL